MKHEPCPFCGGKSIDHHTNSENAYWRVCDDCCAEGPVGKDAKEATHLWNKRPHA